MWRPRKTISAWVMGALVVLLTIAPALAQQAAKPETFTPQITGTLGSPDATTTISGKQLPPPAPKFGGVIKELAVDSKPWWPPGVVPPKGAPNVLLILIDDAGYGVTSTFGGVIPTPTLDRLAKNGLLYTAMHNTALCSPTRAALITGRNHHSVAYGVISELATGFPGYDGTIPKDKATIGRILQDNGYATSWFGKDHNTPAWVTTGTGPFDLWPSGYGFQYFYGFPVGETNQWSPYLYRDHTPIYPWVGKPEGTWNLTTAMADEAIDWMRQIDATHPEKPFLLYYCPGATHAPHHPTKEWIDKISALKLFDEGWEKLRERIFENQKRLGVIPANAKLTPWPEEGAGKLPKWESLTPEQKKLYIKQADVFAAYTAYVDYETGRVIEEIERQGKLDNTLIIWLHGDNGTSAEGTLTGTFNDYTGYNGILELPTEVNMAYYDKWGGPETAPHMSVCWAWAFDTPYRWVKQIASHFGGTRCGAVISWPARIKDKGGIRNQFHHVIDVVPTILEAAGIRAPEVVDGIKQKPIEGVSMMYTFDVKNANAPSNRKTQYFEMGGYRGIYHDGWYACTEVLLAPWQPQVGTKLPNPLEYPWELYDLTKDWTQFDDVAAKYPAKLKELQQVFMAEAKKYDVLPLDNRGFERILQPRPSGSPGLTEFTYTSPISIALGAEPPYLGRDFTITADIVVPEGSAEGMIITQGGRFNGYGFYLLKGKPVFLYNALDLKRFRWEGTDALSPGKHTVVFDFKYDGPGLGKGGTGVLKVDGKEVARQTILHTTPIIQSFDEGCDVGFDTRTGVNDADYQLPFRFTGTLEKVTFKPGLPQFTPEEAKKAAEMKARASD